jgi:hypothetical protein
MSTIPNVIQTLLDTFALLAARATTKKSCLIKTENVSRQEHYEVYDARGCHRLLQESTGANIPCENFTIPSKVSESREGLNILNAMIYDRVASAERSFVTNAALFARTFEQGEREFSRVSATPTRVSTLPRASSKKPNAESNRPAQNSSKPIIVILIGSAVKGVGSRIKGHAKLGG